MSEIVYGLNTIRSILDNNPKIIKESYIILNLKLNIRIIEIIRLLKKNKININYINKNNINKFTNIKEIKNIFIIIYNNKNIIKKIVKMEDLLNKNIILILENIQDPRNLGSCLRSADVANIDCVIITKYKSSPITEVVRKVASGAVDNLNIFIVKNIINILIFLKKNNINILGTSDKSNKIIFNYKFELPIAIIFGSECKGIRNITSRYCNDIIKIPILGKTNSLNVSVSVGIFLFEIIRQNYFK
ncbi:23S rRNA (guanosine(2251)-2'-O)-methyltransferase RlmB [endosymbiont of Pachyrhynchus infernalis]|uniref:23S rRNA (guanosine(2251)-2'-O)-methyltransferase RlmB n=1 Tax=endosymbiont of Pachyrhynchus infernalis TaxID=1971488 RepID=UPI000DC71C66|nr:23S rRNA (guanosine(2251)-2'-O)-methyltransferase RlmB [endosymbiont of Pachyrhynchus infernalis]BBA84935.1 23S rRNA (guanosine-2'-O-)-methyltransferase RlmB [endosymbiont of Pachyrhynchus infernalis]